jgi:hypothetical protein
VPSGPASASAPCFAATAIALADGPALGLTLLDRLADTGAPKLRIAARSGHRPGTRVKMVE